MTFRELLAIETEQLQQAKIEDAANDAWLLLAEVYSMTRTDLLLRGTQTMTVEEESQKDLYLQWIARREDHEPLQYIVGKAPFMGLEFTVNEAVLIPRFDTEVLVEKAGAFIKKQSSKEVLDMCTGSGCIAISLAQLYGCDVTAVDLSEDALCVAKKNASDLVHNGSVTFVQSDMFTAVEGVYDLIVSNPPYIRPEVIEELAVEVKDREPRMALDGGLDGLDFYRILAKESAAHLRAGGKLMLEIGYDQADDVCELLVNEGYQDIEVVKDLAGLPRDVCATRP